MNDLVGYIGVILLMWSSISLNTKYKKDFFIYLGFASAFLLWHAINLMDIPFIVVNGVSLLSALFGLFYKEEYITFLKFMDKRARKMDENERNRKNR